MCCLEEVYRCLHYKNIFLLLLFSVVNVYHDHLKFWVVCINGRRYVCCGECYVISSEWMSPPSALCTVVKLCTFGVLALGVSLVS